MSAPSIVIEALGKRYTLGTDRPALGARTLRDALAARFRGTSRGAMRDSLWALRDISMQVEQGEIVGIIGRNGAGKSTLLKLLAGITRPTEGRLRVRGRVASLLEVGTGFHAELTGRENVYLNGAVLGMPRREIARNFDAIVAFAGVERFIDTPVKRYSTGMYLRLAFSVAAHLNADILLVDEVLAVGDAEFQKKCLGKMDDVVHDGRTVLFVSHNLPAVRTLCRRAVLLRDARVAHDGTSDDVIAAYLASIHATDGERVWDTPDEAPGDDVARLHAVRVRGADGRPASTIDIQQSITVEMEFWNRRAGSVLVPNLHFIHESGVHLFATAVNHTEEARALPAGLVRCACRIPGNFFAAARISVAANVSTLAPQHVIHVSEQDAVVFQVIDTGGVRGQSVHGWPGVIRPDLPWSIDVVNMEPPR